MNDTDTIETRCMKDQTTLERTLGTFGLHLADSTRIELSNVPGWKCPTCGQFTVTGKELRLQTIKFLATIQDESM